MGDTPGSGLSGMRCFGTFHHDGKTFPCPCTVYRGSSHGSGPCETLITLPDDGDQLPPIQCGHARDEHRDE
jgi:hypothetical protein